LKITNVESDGQNIILDRITHKFSSKIIEKNTLCLNLYIQLLKPFNHDEIFTDQYFVNVTITIGPVMCVYYETDYQSRSCWMGQAQYFCTLYEFDSGITMNNLSIAYNEIRKTAIWVR